MKKGVHVNGEYMNVDEDGKIAWWKSKKFLALMIGSLTWKALLLVAFYIVATYNQGVLSGSWLIFLSFIVVTEGVVQIGFIGGQAWIDKYVAALQVPASLATKALQSDDSEPSEEGQNSDAFTDNP